MFCTQCGKEIADDAMVCPYCNVRLREGAPDSQMAGNILSAGYGGSQGYQGQAGYGGSQGYQGQAGYGGPYGYQGQQGYGGPQGYQGQAGYGGPYGYQGQPGYGAPQNYGMPVQNVNKDDKFVFWAGFGIIGIIWCFLNGLWDLALFQFVIGLIGMAISMMIPVVGLGIDLFIWIARIVIIGRNANYYKRLKKEMNIMPYQAFGDPNLRRI